MLEATLIRHIVDQYPLQPKGIHGVFHWARVYENGMLLAEKTGADKKIVALFSIFHDCRRSKDGIDFDHGRLAAEYAETIRSQFLDLCDGDFALLRFACAYHTSGQTEADITVQTCWDADRLDLLRVGIKPVSRFLCTEAAKDEEILRWANERSSSHYIPVALIRTWNCPELLSFPSISKKD